jgi:hypothetical protein
MTSRAPTDLSVDSGACLSPIVGAGTRALDVRFPGMSGIRAILLTMHNSSGLESLLALDLSALRPPSSAAAWDDPCGRSRLFIGTSISAFAADPRYRAVCSRLA